MHIFACLVNSTEPLMRHSPGLLSIRDPTFSNQNKALAPSCRQLPSMTMHSPRWNILHEHHVQERFLSPLCSLVLISHHFQLNLYQWGFQKPPCCLGLGVHADLSQGLLCYTFLGASSLLRHPLTLESQRKDQIQNWSKQTPLTLMVQQIFSFQHPSGPGGHLEQISCVHSVVS